MFKRHKRRRYTREFKAEAVRLAKESGEPSRIAKELGIPCGTFFAWWNAAVGSTPVEIRDTTAPVGDLEKENARLRQELERVKLERDFLKKAAAFFAKSES